MSDYTITLKRCSEVYGKDEVLSWFLEYNLSDYLTEEQISLIKSRQVFNPNFLATMIFNHYYFREIAYETPEMFRHFATTKMREVMRNLCSSYLFSFTYI